MKKVENRRCKHRLESGVCELTGKSMKETCFEWRCRSFEPAQEQEIEEKKEEEKSLGAWKPEYGRGRKTYTSTEVKARYNAKTYDRLTVTLPKGSADLLKAKAEEQGVSVNQLIKSLIVREMPECISYGGGGGKRSLKDLWESLERKLGA